VANAATAGLPHDWTAVSASIIVSYDGTPNDDDAIALARAFKNAGVILELAYVRHAREFDERREQLAQHDAERRLEQGAALLGDADIPRHVVVSASTGEGLRQLAEAQNASMIVFGSDYRTPPGRVEPQATAQHLLEGGPVAIAVASAGLRTASEPRISAVKVAAANADTAASQTAQALAEKIGAKFDPDAGGDADLIIVGSQDAGPSGRVTLSGAMRAELSQARCSVLVVPHGKPIAF
jgi:nucleotide-binding universal stress UspA family protein